VTGDRHEPAADWREYAALARRLDDLRRAAEGSAAEVARRQDAVAAGFAALDRRLPAQRERLSQLGAAIGEPFGNQPILPAAGAGDPVAALHTAWLRADEADVAGTEAERLAQHPPLFPMWTPFARNLTVYALCALAAVAAQTALLVAADTDRIDPLTLLAWLCAGLPAMAFFAGAGVISVWGKPRVHTGTPPPRHLRLGFALCFLAMPAVYCGYRLVAAILPP
jgi:hypothetical protein